MSSEKEEEYRFVRISAENLDDFSALTKNAFGIASTLEERKSLFDTAAWGKENIGFLAYHAATGEVAGFYGIFPCFVEYDGRRYLAAQSGSTMTHSNHRRKGLFYQLGKKTFELARDEGINFVYGFPNVNSYPGLMKLGWTHDGNMKSYHLFVPTLPIGLLARRFAFFRPLFDRWFQFVAGFWRTASRPFPSSAIEPKRGALHRDEALLNYKRDSDNRFMIEIGGRSVWINQQSGSVGLGDVELPATAADGKDDEERRAFKKAMRTLKLICFLSGAVHLRTYVSPDCRLDRLLTENGYRARKGLANCYLNLNSDLPLADFKYVYADFDTF